MLTLPVLCFHPTLPLYLSSGFATHVVRGACGRACISASREQHTVTRIQQLSGCRPSFVFFVFGSQPHLYQCARQRDFSSPRDLKLGSCHSDHGSRFSGRCPRPATRAVVSLRLSGRSLHFAVTSREQRTHDQNIASAALDASSRVNRGTRELHSSCSPLRLRLRLDNSGNSIPLRYAA